MEFLSGMTEYSIFNTSESYEKTGYQYFKLYAQEIVEELNNIYYSMDNEYNFNFEYTNFFDFGSEAFHRNGTDYLLVNDGVVIKAFEVFYSILSHFSVFSFLESSKQGSLGYKLSYHFYDNQQYETYVQFPLQREKKIIAEYMAMFAIKFVILHELAHHYNGHILYQDSFINVFKEKVSLLDLQTMEMDADCFAVSRLIDEVLNLLEKDTRLCSTIRNIENIFVMFVVALSTMFLIIRNESTLQVNDVNSSHLSTFVRLAMCIECAKVNIAHKAKDIITETDFEILAKKAVIEAENYYYNLFGQSHYNDALEYDLNTSTHLSKLNDNWVKLRPQLLLFARVPLATAK